VFQGAEESEKALFDAIDAGAIAYLTTSATTDQLLEAIRRASLGEVLIRSHSSPRPSPASERRWQMQRNGNSVQPCSRSESSRF
jgi:DNA-binding NarL/FixJ family response regulator